MSRLLGVTNSREHPAQSVLTGQMLMLKLSVILKWIWHFQLLLTPWTDFFPFRLGSLPVLLAVTAYGLPPTPSSYLLVLPLIGWYSAGSVFGIFGFFNLLQ